MARKNAFKPSIFEPSRRRRKRMPRWLVILLTGIVLGAGGFWFIQTNYGPKRFTVEESQSLVDEAKQANADKQKLMTENKSLQSEVAQLKNRLGIADQKSKTQNASLQTSKDRVSQLQEQVTELRQALLADGTDAPVVLRNPQFTAAAGSLGYNFFLIQRQINAAKMTVHADWTIGGVYSNGRKGYATVQKDFVVGDLTKISGQLDLPSGLTPSNVTLKVSNSDGKTVYIRRTYRVK